MQVVHPLNGNPDIHWEWILYGALKPKQSQILVENAKPMYLKLFSQNYGIKQKFSGIFCH